MSAKEEKPKNIVICSDGTGNSANKDRGTNVFKLYEAIDLIDPPIDPNDPRQIAIYDDGVGTETWKPLRLLTGALGLGLSRNVKELYTALVRSYRPGDRIFLFGFSRGAFTVRTLGGLITSCGILKMDQFQKGSNTDLLAAVKDTYRVYRARYMTGARHDFRRLRTKLPGQSAPPSPGDIKATELRSKYQFHDSREIAFIGVWDTVDAVGLPFDHLADFINYAIYPFKFSDKTLHENVKQGRHAVSIDDERHTFHPVMWQLSDADAKDPERIKQVWFAGVHSNIGGGYPKQGMSLVSLEWMMAEAAAAGLRFVKADRDFCKNHENVNDKLYNSRSGVGLYYRYKPRDIREFCARAKTGAYVHESVIDRIKQRTEGYAPGNLPADLKVVTTRSRSPRYPDAASVIKESYGSEESLLNRVKGLIRVRRWAYVVYVLLTAWALWVAIEPTLPSAENGVVAKFIAIFSGDFKLALMDALKHNILFDVIVVMIAVFVVIVIIAEEKMQKRFSAFWHTVVPQLSGLSK